MNINQYKKSMDEIIADKIEFNDLLRKNVNKVNKYKFIKEISVCIIVCILIVNLYPFTNFSQHTPNIIIKAYAAEKDIPLTNDFINFSLDANKINGGLDSNRCFVNYNLYFQCEGDNISTITYTCSDQNINVSNRLNATAYYVENTSVPAYEYSNYISNRNFIFGYKAEGEDIAKITKLIGNSYTVDYKNQNNKQYGLVLAGSVDVNGRYQFDDTIIKVDITLNDNTTQHKKLIIKGSKGSFSEVQIRIL